MFGTSANSKKIMKQQILVIQGGTTFDTYDDYIFYLKNREIGLDKLKQKRDWKSHLEKDLGEEFEVIFPAMPNRTNSHYEEWMIWFERILTLLNDDLILIGHSQGGIFLAKYLSENIIPKRIRAIILIAAPFDDIGLHESLGDFKLKSNFSKFVKQSNTIYLVFSKDDPIVPFNHLEKYKKELPNAKEIIFENRGHFKQEKFPEIIELIKKL